MSERKWIPVKEKLPPLNTDVWVTIHGHDVIRTSLGTAYRPPVRYVTDGFLSDEGWCDPMFGGPLIIAPIAWMEKEPQPEPWEG